MAISARRHVIGVPVRHSGQSDDTRMDSMFGHSPNIRLAVAKAPATSHNLPDCPHFVCTSLEDSEAPKNPPDTKGGVVCPKTDGVPADKDGRLPM